MKNQRLIIFLIIGLIMLGVYIAKTKKTTTVSNFTECAALYPVMESYPRQCVTPDGQSFVEEISASPFPTPEPQESPTPTSPAQTLTPPGVVCTLEAKLCPDGTYVGRQGPNCEFKLCPKKNNPNK